MARYSWPTARRTSSNGCRPARSPPTPRRPRPRPPARLRAAFAGVRQQGDAYCPGHVHEEALGVAAPVRGADGRVVEALSVVVPDDAGARGVVPVVRTAARGVSRALGAHREGTG
ncbi:IclR family transcriptional regulator domain-containing protein [Streptomyces sp. enrichment culture]|uniref:IclR family transcriptional regulator domain-containing protein n=1 Tax=Streptomyces sp. enrichment culture TaxID=1795815 RepID=UPI003F543E8E